MACESDSLDDNLNDDTQNEVEQEYATKSWGKCRKGTRKEICKTHRGQQTPDCLHLIDSIIYDFS